MHQHIFSPCISMLNYNLSFVILSFPYNISRVFSMIFSEPRLDIITKVIWIYDSYLTRLCYLSCLHISDIDMQDVTCTLTWMKIIFHSVFVHCVVDVFNHTIKKIDGRTEESHGGHVIEYKLFGQLTHYYTPPHNLVWIARLKVYIYVSA